MSDLCFSELRRSIFPIDSSVCRVATTIPLVKVVKSIFHSYPIDSFGHDWNWPIGESLFTLFPSLAYAYHYLMTLIK